MRDPDSVKLLPCTGTILYKENSRYWKFEGDVYSTTCNPKEGILYYHKSHKEFSVFQGNFNEHGEPVEGELTYKEVSMKERFIGTIENRKFKSGSIVFKQNHPMLYQEFFGCFHKGEPASGKMVFTKNHSHYFFAQQAISAEAELDMFDQNGELQYGRVYLKCFPNLHMETFDYRNFYYWEGPFKNGYPIGQGTFGFVFHEENDDRQYDDDSLLLTDAEEVSGFFDKNSIFKSCNGKLSGKHTERFWQLKPKLDNRILSKFFEKNSDSKRQREDSFLADDCKRRKQDGESKDQPETLATADEDIFDFDLGKKKISLESRDFDFCD